MVDVCFALVQQMGVLKPRIVNVLQCAFRWGKNVHVSLYRGHGEGRRVLEGLKGSKGERRERREM
jgi:hypothetical protein